MSHKIRNDTTENTVQTSKDSTGGVNFITFLAYDQGREEPTVLSKLTQINKYSIAADIRDGHFKNLGRAFPEN